MARTVSRRAALVIVASMILIVAGCSPRATPTPFPTATPSPSLISPPTVVPASPSPFATPVPSPVPVTPVTPTSAEVVVRVVAGDDVDGPRLRIVLYADGSLLDLTGRFAGDWRQPPVTVLRLSRAGLDAITSRLRDSGLFTSSRPLPAPSPALPMGHMEFDVTFVIDGKPIRLSANNQSTHPDVKAFIAIATDLLDPLSWLPDEAFVDGDRAWHPYRAAATRVTSEVIPVEPTAWTNPTQSIDRVAWPLATPPELLGDPLRLESQPERTLRCGVIGGSDEARIRSALIEFTGRREDEAGETTGWDVWLPGSALLRLTLRPFLPDEAAGCDGTAMPGAPSLDNASRPTLAAVLRASAGGLTPADSGPYMFVSVGRGDGIRVKASYYADGTIVFTDPPPPAVGLGARRLTAFGGLRVQQSIDDSGLLESSYNEQVPDDATGYLTYSIVIDPVIINVTDRGVDPKATAIVGLAKRLLDPPAWLPASAWVGGSAAIQPYRPGVVWASMTLHTPTGECPGFGPWLATSLRWPLAGTLATFGASDPGMPCLRTSTIPTADALLLVDALAAAGSGADGVPTWVDYVLPTATPGTTIAFRLWVVAGAWGP